jgi:phosphomethylpyrimidine synthase
MKITQEVRDLAAKQNAGAETFLAAEAAEAGMAEMSEVFRTRAARFTSPTSSLRLQQEDLWRNHAFF